MACSMQSGSSARKFELNLVIFVTRAHATAHARPARVPPRARSITLSSWQQCPACSCSWAAASLDPRPSSPPDLRPSGRYRSEIRWRWAGIEAKLQLDIDATELQLCAWSVVLAVHKNELEVELKLLVSVRTKHPKGSNSIFQELFDGIAWVCEERGTLCSTQPCRRGGRRSLLKLSPSRWLWMVWKVRALVRFSCGHTFCSLFFTFGNFLFSSPTST